ncbi:MAG: hypothetical protein IRY92_11565 [Dactylosporangium sp.]|nr:hypothetical protein [Dactylosporangium sp.]
MTERLPIPGVTRERIRDLTYETFHQLERAIYQRVADRPATIRALASTLDLLIRLDDRWEDGGVER